MNFIKKLKGIIVATGIFVIALAICYCYPGQQDISTDVQVNESVNKDVLIETEDYTKDDLEESITPATAVPSDISEPDAEMEFQEASIAKSALHCSVAVRCDTLLYNMDRIVPEKKHLIPENGLILNETELEFSEGESAFDVLKRELKNRNIHFEFTDVPIYDSVYIEGIGNLYEFDAGNLSGWIYRVNGKTLSVGCSQYKLKSGDRIEFLYTCDMGRDL